MYAEIRSACYPGEGNGFFAWTWGGDGRGTGVRKLSRNMNG